VRRTWEVRQNAVWRRGRVFLRCPRCQRCCTRLYLPLETLWLACRRCWGLTYVSRQLQNYKDSFWGRGTIARMFGTTQRDWALGVLGDGFTRFEEYRGFVGQGIHRRTSTSHKDLFVTSIVSRPAPGLLLSAQGLDYARGSMLGHGIRLHQLYDETELYDAEYGSGRHVNFANQYNNGSIPIPQYQRTDQLLLRIVAGPLAAGVYGLTNGGDLCDTFPPATATMTHGYTPNGAPNITISVTAHTARSNNNNTVNNELRRNDWTRNRPWSACRTQRRHDTTGV
jgi:hypothetical protein